MNQWKLYISYTYLITNFLQRNMLQFYLMLLDDYITGTSTGKYNKKKSHTHVLNIFIISNTSWHQVHAYDARKYPIISKKAQSYICTVFTGITILRPNAALFPSKESNILRLKSKQAVIMVTRLPGKCKVPVMKAMMYSHVFFPISFDPKFVYLFCIIPPNYDMVFSQWVDGTIFTFGIEDY